MSYYNMSGSRTDSDAVLRDTDRQVVAWTDSDTVSMVVIQTLDRN